MTAPITETIAARAASEIADRHRRPIHISRSGSWTYCGIVYTGGRVLCTSLAEYEDFEGAARWCSTCERGVAAHVAMRERATEGRPACR